LLKMPKSDGAIAMPHGAFRLPPTATSRLTSVPAVSNTSTAPKPAPVTSSSASGVLPGVAHVELVADRLDAERRVARGQVGIGERACRQRDLVEAGVEDVDDAVVEVGRVEEVGAALRRAREDPCRSRRRPSGRPR
jgi:hypothetical protein